MPLSFAILCGSAPVGKALSVRATIEEMKHVSPKCERVRLVLAWPRWLSPCNEGGPGFTFTLGCP